VELKSSLSVQSSSFAERVFVRYQGFIDDAYTAGLKAQAAGRLKPIPRLAPETQLGQYVDRFARADLMNWLKSERIAEGPGGLVQVNRHLRDPLGSGTYRIPDIQLPGSGIIFDGTISSSKSIFSPQIIDFNSFSGGNNIVIIRPTQLGGSYGLVFP
jgi:hypothetical protein